MGDASIACGETDNPLIVPELWLGRGRGRGRGRGSFHYLP
jgi:hypothetical protein